MSWEVIALWLAARAVESVIIVVISTIFGAYIDEDIKDNGNYRHDLGSTCGFAVGLLLALVNVAAHIL